MIDFGEGAISADTMFFSAVATTKMPRMAQN